MIALIDKYLINSFLMSWEAALFYAFVIGCVFVHWHGEHVE